MGLERRQHFRVPFEHEADLVVANRVYGCLVHDFCPGGLLVELVSHGGHQPEGLDGVTFGTLVDVQLSIGPEFGNKRLQIIAEIRHQSRGMVGLQFHSISESTLALLKQMTDYHEKCRQYTASNPVSNSRSRYGSNTLHKLITGYRQVILQRLPIALEHTLKTVCEKLLSEINATADPRLRADYDLSFQMIDRRGAWIADQVSQKVIDRLAAIIDQNSPPPIPDKQDNTSQIKLEVLDKDAFEDWLAVNVAIRTIENELGHDLGKIADILTNVSGQKFDVQSCPVGPENIVKTLSTVFNNLELPSATQPVMFKAVGRVLQNELKDIYAVLVAGARRIGIQVEPETSSSVTANPPSDSPDPLKASGSANDKGQGENSSGKPVLVEAHHTLPHHLQQTREQSNLIPANNVSTVALSSNPHIQPLPGAVGFSAAPYGFLTSPFTSAEVQTVEGLSKKRLELTTRTLRNLINLNTSVSKGGTLSDSSHRFVKLEADARLVGDLEKDALVNAVSSLQKLLENRQEANRLKGKSLEYQLNSVLAVEAGGRSIAGEDQDIIRITDQLFKSMQHQQGVSDGLKQWIEKLKLAMLKVILLDSSFFGNAEHPARRFINQLGKLGPVKPGANRRLDRLLEAFTSRVINHYKGDNTIFGDLLEEVGVLVERQEKAFARNFDRIARAYEGQQQLAKARKNVVDAISERITGKRIPRVVFDFIENAGWKHYLVITLLREGEQSESWQESIRVIDILLHWIGGDAFPYPGSCEFEIDLEAPTLLQMLDRELTTSGQTGYKQVLDQLKKHLFEQVEPEWLDVESYRWTGEGAEEVQKLSTSEKLKVVGRWQRKAVSLSIGDWIEYSGEGEEPQRMRLAWSGTNFYRFVFVSSHGLKDVDILLEDFSAGLEDGRFRILDEDQVPIVDQGLHNMVQSVYKDLAGQASCDPLTGLLNRQEYERYVDRAVADAITNKESYYVIYVDIDQFRVVNNSYGYQVGDNLLKHVARLISSTVPDDVICARLGGNEFGLIYRNQKQKVISSLNRVRLAVMETPFAWENNLIYVTVSIGVGEMIPQSDNIDSVLRKAYLASELAKEQGRNRIVEYALHDKDQCRQDEIMNWVKRIETSLDEFLVLKCQEIRPIRSANNKSHYEVLLGVKDNQGNLLPPINLIEAAERYGRMSKIDRWVVGNALDWMEQNPGVVANLDGLSINLSGTSIGNEAFLEFILDKLSDTGAPLEKVCFEVTETAAVTSLTDACEFIAAVKRKGCKFALDDFGTGLSSYAYIQRLPVDLLKIDGVFIRNIINNKKDEALVRSINDLAHFMGMQTIAEFVENDEILGLLGDIGVDKAQGFGVHKPVLLEALN
ncbi:MAG: hypothetical protein CSB48_01895 [Proteobacteria bacterium]|nr:MAG: hypothetical protein CSB48_01895 [Pseudomonadota bacterium]PIE40386.1 MAG: hypothetical protein CSA51_00895 [Gammaproteobacteria bacterium]